jgi:large subunit ribosomal protein L27
MSLVSLREPKALLLLLFAACVRATKKQGGSTKNKKDSQPKYLGTKMSDGQLAFPGQMLVKQRGTKFHPGHNVGMVRAYRFRILKTALS